MKTGPDKYTQEYVTEQVQLILDLILADKEIVYLGEVFEELPYSRSRFCEWEQEYREIPEISCTIKKIKQVLESRINIGGLKNKLNATMTIFNLKNNYGWKDQAHVEQEVRMVTPIMDITEDKQ